MTSSTTNVTLSTMWLCVLAMLLPAANAENASGAVKSILSSADDISVGEGILAAVTIAVGVVMLVAGYRLFRVAIFVSGFVLGGLGVASLLEYIFENKSWIETASWIGFFVGGVIVGILAMSLYSLSIFVAGAAGGVLLAFTLQTTVAHKIYPSQPNVVLIVLAVVLGLICGVLALKLEKPVLVIATSFIGAVAVAWGIGYYAGEFPNGADLKHYRTEESDGHWIYSIPDAWWGYLAGIVVLFALGLFIQFRKTGRDGNYHKVGRKHHTTNAVPQYNNLDTPPVHAQGGNPRYGNPVSHV
ncbi:hypothetical protein Poli38472_011560 [Pythium oligandrum]|uniref:Transmembrane protein 198 n=1 Tax=Pythium oligandrum TaxID=41045 RepID=A0A8K1FI72_PYTOL|nr:hypothetical protein Poli38472_011560 [Pythium oligandrum]|eukprot:TMW64680.1 hypothetical protein Poli38472_011560 [Pythium oligandrum]